MFISYNCLIKSVLMTRNYLDKVVTSMVDFLELIDVGIVGGINP